MSLSKHVITVVAITAALVAAPRAAALDADEWRQDLEFLVQ